MDKSNKNTARYENSFPYTFYDSPSETRKEKGKYIFNKKKTTKINSGNVTLSTVTSLNYLKDFFNVSQHIYKDDPHWIAPFWNEYKGFFKTKNPFWTHADAQLFTAHKNHDPIGRIAAIIDYLYCKTYNEKTGFFGFFECMQDFQCAKSLINSAQEWLKSKGMAVMRGPINGRIDIGCGFLYAGFNSPPSLLSSYSPEHYISFFEKMHMKKTRDQVVYYIDLTQPIPQPLKDKADQCKSSGVTIRPFSRLRAQRDLELWIDLFIETFENHWGYIPVPPEEIKSRFGVKYLRWFVDPELFLFAEYEGKPIAYIWSTPDYNQIFQDMDGQLGPSQIIQFLKGKKKIKKGKLHLIGIKKEFRNHNIGSYLNYNILDEMKKRGYVGAEVGWIDEHNTIAHTTIALTGAQVFKKYRVFDKKISTI
jgi:hypothetical protein